MNYVKLLIYESRNQRVTHLIYELRNHNFINNLFNIILHIFSNTMHTHKMHYSLAIAIIIFIKVIFFTAHTR